MTHGTRACYTRGCRQPECRAANTRYQAELTRQATPPYRSAGPAREHVQALMAGGVGLKTIAAASGVSHGAISKLIYGDTTRAPSKRIRPATHDRLMKVTIADAANAARVDAAATWRLVNEMTDAGVPKTAIARELGQQGSGLQLGPNQVRAGTARAVADIHRRWRDGDLELVRRDRHGGEQVIEPGPLRPAESQYRVESVTRLFDTIAEIVAGREEPWRERAQCRTAPTWVFFPYRGDRQATAAARRICETCPVQAECAAAASGHGVWGGLTAKQRATA